MRSQVTKRILASTPKSVKDMVRKVVNMIVNKQVK